MVETRKLRKPTPSSPMVETRKSKKPTKKNHHNQQEMHYQNHQQPPSSAAKSPSWKVVKDILVCKHLQDQPMADKRKKCRKSGCSVSLCSLRDNTRVMHRPETSPETGKGCGYRKQCDGSVVVATGSSRSLKAPVNESNSNNGGSVTCSSGSSIGGSFRGMHFRRLSGCYECHMVVDPINGVSRDPSLRSTICACPDCGEIFMKPEILELHQSVRHAVSELGPEDSSRNIVEIIFQSSWLKKETPVCKIDRILKVLNSQKTINKFEDYRDTVKARANKHPKKHPRCIADGNELLRFHSTTFVCSIGLNGSSNLCNSIPNCNVCNIIKNGFKIDGVGGICTTASSGKAHDCAQISSTEASEKRGMLVCRVISGRVKKSQDSVDEALPGSFDSIAGEAGIYSNLDELYVFNPRAILPCFVVIYTGSG